MSNATAAFSNTSAAESNVVPPHRLIPCMSDEALAVIMPVFAYWIYSIAFHFIMKAEIPCIEKYRIHTLEEMKTKNKVSLYEVLRMVLVQQTLQTILGIMVLPSEEPTAVNHLFMLQMYEENLYRYLAPIFALGQSHITDEVVQWLAYAAYWIVVPALHFFVAM
jgi:sphinganine C4-monooxygenase